jgi:hypothetical protein
MTDQDKDNEQRMRDPCNPMDFLFRELRLDWLEASVRFWRCDIAF